MIPDLFVHIFDDSTEKSLVLSSAKMRDINFSTGLPGGFQEGSFTLPSLYYDATYWKEKLLGKHVVVTDAAGERAYEGTVEALDNTSGDGMEVQTAGYWAKAGLRTDPLVYIGDNRPQHVLREAAALVKEWNVVQQIPEYEDMPYVRDKVYLPENKVQEVIEDMLKLPVSDYELGNFAIYDFIMPWFFTKFAVSYKVARHNLSLTYGSSVSLSGVYNKIQTMYDEGNGKRYLPYFDDLLSQAKYGIREGTLDAGSTAAAIAQIALDLTTKRVTRPVEQQHLEIHGQVYNFVTSMSEPAWKLRAGQWIYVTDLAPTDAQKMTNDSTSIVCRFFVLKTSYSHNDRTQSIEVGDGLRALESYMQDMGISGGSVK